MVADLWQRTGEISGCLKNSTSVVLPQCQNKVIFHRKDSSIVSKFPLHRKKELSKVELLETSKVESVLF